MVRALDKADAMPTFSSAL